MSQPAPHHHYDPSRTHQGTEDKGNQIAELCARILDYCVHKSIAASVENPFGSFIWDFLHFKEVARKCVRVDFDACMHSASRDKRTTSLCSDSTFQSTANNDKSHKHAPWGVHFDGKWSFRIAKECAFPAEMCRTIASSAAGKYHQDHVGWLVLRQTWAKEEVHLRGLIFATATTLID